ncbi:cation:proton antiporter [Ktedonospora formicarum]|uniref:Potassium transporter n=1 Tax=Ktedonospora formicarum TaxID=2778364 RepID=A0A8J3IB10_9CHLR|nr:cation:proton antiporter [Ktedonospora formicarum]GHO48024.1 potassium transporter [Ktedonospora formicarum]
MSNSELAILFTLQLAVILGVCRLVGFLARKIGQPQVVGEMIAGVLMGPSFFGLFWPDLQHMVFPKGAPMGILYSVSQVGLVLYMFLIGVEFDTNLIRSRLRSAVSVSLAGIIAPLTLGALLAYMLVNQTGFFGPGVAIAESMLFMGAAIAVTAFPMLARIIYERGLSGTSLGTLALAAGSSDDAISWCILAVVLAVFKQNMTIALLAVGGGIIYAVSVLTVGKRMLSVLGKMTERRGGMTGGMLAFVLLLVMLAGWVTDTIGIYSIFGGFILGVAMPRGLFSKYLKTTLEPLVTNFLLPLFFVYSGLNTSLGLVNSWLLWGVAILIFVIAVFGKGVACWAAALLNKEPPREALAIGSLMNARGLMELILLNIGLQQGVITPTLFTMLVLMAIATTLMSSPLFELVYGRYRRERAVVKGEDVIKTETPAEVQV